MQLFQRKMTIQEKREISQQYLLMGSYSRGKWLFKKEKVLMMCRYLRPLTSSYFREVWHFSRTVYSDAQLVQRWVSLAKPPLKGKVDFLFNFSDLNTLEMLFYYQWLVKNAPLKFHRCNQYMLKMCPKQCPLANVHNCLLHQFKDSLIAELLIRARQNVFAKFQRCTQYLL